MAAHPHIIVKVVWLSVVAVLLAGSAIAQRVQSPPRKFAFRADEASQAAAIANVKSGVFFAADVDLIGRADLVEAIPVLKQQFPKVSDPIIKAKIAAAIVRLGDKDDTYWDFLVMQVNPMVESDAPDFMSYDAQGKAASEPSPDFVAWADARNLPHAGLLDESKYLQPAMVDILGWSRDPRAIPLLRQALLSRNYMIEIAGAMGLAEIGDKDSIPLIIDACRKAPAEPASVIAEALIYFDDDSAQNAVDQFIPKDTAKIYRDAKAHGNTKPLSPSIYEPAPNP
jgi:hypothetical protein